MSNRYSTLFQRCHQRLQTSERLKAFGLRCPEKLGIWEQVKGVADSEVLILRKLNGLMVRT